MDLPPGVRARTLTDPTDADIEIAVQVADAASMVAVGWSDVTVERIRNELTGPEALRDAALLAYRDDRPVGLVMLACDATGRELFMTTYSAEEKQRPMLDLLVEHAIGAARDRAAQDPVQPLAAGIDPFVLAPDVWQLLAGSFEGEDDYDNCLQDQGFRRIRWFWRMRWDVAGLSPEEPPAPAGVVRRVVRGEADSRLFHQLFSTSFAEHFGSSHDQPYEEWINAVRALDGHDPERCWIAELDGVPVAMCMTDDSRAAFGNSHVRTLGVLPAARGRGIGRWLLQCAAADTVRRDLTGVTLGVDTENETGATALYESVGFTVQHVIGVWCLPLT